MTKPFFLSFFVTITLILTGCTSNEESKNINHEREQAQANEFAFTNAAAGRIEQIYGIGYPGNDNGLYLATQEGLKVFTNNEWLEGNSENHEYVGFQATKDGFYASGHPEKGTNFKDPLGLIKSTDKGATFEDLAFYGEGDFHFLSAGYDTNILYVINEKENPVLKAGVYRSEDEGQSWEPLLLNDLHADTVGMIATHPTNEQTMAMATRSGIYLSEDKGDHMRLVTEPVMVTALALSENYLYYAAVKNNKVLFYEMDLNTLNKVALNIPFLNYDNPITYIAVDYKNDQTLSFSTYLFDVYQSMNRGETWDLKIKNGKIK